MTQRFHFFVIETNQPNQSNDIEFLDGVDGNEEYFIFCHHNDKVAIWFWID